MKILELHYSTACAGAERIVTDLCNEMAQGHDVTLCTIEDDNIPSKAFYKRELLPQVKYINLGCRSGNDIKGFWRICKIIRKLEPDVVHAHTDALNLWLPALLYTKCSYFHTIHNLAAKRQYRPWLTCVYKLFYKYRIKAITISPVCKQSYINLYGLNNCVLIENGRSEMKLTSFQTDVHECIKGLKIHDDDKVFIHVSRCSEAKNEPLLFDTFNRVLSEGYHVILLIIGANFDLPEYKHLLLSAHRGIYWLGTKNNVVDYLFNADFFVLSSKWEGLPISLLEAMSVGIIPVCTPAGGIPDVISSPNLGFVSPSMAADDFYDTIKMAISHSEKVDRELLRRHFRMNYSMKHCAEQYIQVFRKHMHS